MSAALYGLYRLQTHSRIRCTQKALFPPGMPIIIAKRTGEVNLNAPYIEVNRGSQSRSASLPMRSPRLLAAYRNENGHTRCGGIWQRAKRNAGRLAEETLPPRRSSVGSACPFFAQAKAAERRAETVLYSLCHICIEKLMLFSVLLLCKRPQPTVTNVNKKCRINSAYRSFYAILDLLSEENARFQNFCRILAYRSPQIMLIFL